jgi:hypothetical protein
MPEGATAFYKLGKKSIERMAQRANGVQHRAA